MRLSFEQINTVTAGAVLVNNDGDSGIRFYKCTEGQTRAWQKCSEEALAARTLTTTGIRLDFHTNSKSFAFKAFSGEKFELLIDGILRERFVPEEGCTSVEKRVSLCDPIGRKKDDTRVTLVFPSHKVGILDYVELDDGAYVRKHEYSTKLLFIGDSITQGWNTGFDSLSFAHGVSSFFNAESVINGNGGAFYEPKTFEKIDFDPDTVIVAYGTNDATRFKNFADMESRVKGYLDLVKEAYSDKKVVIISPIWRGTEDGTPMGEDFDNKRKMIEREAGTRGFFVISGLELVPPMPDFFADTYLHPNDLGFCVYTQNLIAKLIKII